MRFDVYDLFFVVGVGLSCYGLHLAWPPLAFIASGVALVGVAVARKRTPAGRR